MATFPRISWKAWWPRTITRFMLVQIAVLAGAILGVKLGLSVVAAMAGAGLFAVVLTRWLRVESWWLGMAAVFPSAVWLALQWSLPPIAWLLAFIAMLLIFGNAAGERVPLYLSGKGVAPVLTQLMRERAGASMVDLGSGTGSVVLAMGRLRPDVLCCGAETSRLPLLVSQLRAALERSENTGFTGDDLWSVDLGRFDLVYCFLSPVPMPRLYAKALAEMRPGAWLVSNSFAVPGIAPDRVLETDDRSRRLLYVWQMPGPNRENA